MKTVKIHYMAQKHFSLRKRIPNYRGKVLCNRPFLVKTSRVKADITCAFCIGKMPSRRTHVASD